MQIEEGTSDCQCHIILSGPISVDKWEKRKVPVGMINNKVLEKLYMDALVKLEAVWEVSRNGSYILFHSVPTQMATLKLLMEM